MHFKYVYFYLGFSEIPQIGAFTFPSHVVAGKNISAFCSASDSKFSWLKDGKVLKNSPNVTIRTDEDFSVIIIKSVSVLSNGNYTCMAMNNFGLSSKSTTLTVISKP